MEQPGWLGSLRVAGLFMSGVVVGSLGSGIMEQKFAVGSSAGTYALIMAHFGTFWQHKISLQQGNYIKIQYWTNFPALGLNFKLRALL